MNGTIAPTAQATQRQFDFLKNLIAERELTTELNEWVVAARHFAMAGTLSKKAASQLIDALLEAPKKQDAANERARRAFVEPGRYALRTEDHIDFYVVSKKGFVQVQASDTLYPVRNRQQREQILDRIAADMPGASRLYGQQIGSCGVCGRTLTDDVSRANGIGPVCAERTGW